jgi:hypothetical protein
MGTSREKLRAWNTGIHRVAEKVLGKEGAAGKRGHLHLSLPGRKKKKKIERLIYFFTGRLGHVPHGWTAQWTAG